MAFFDNSDCEIVHVDIILENNHIIHAHGHVRVNRLDQTGIFNPNLERIHTSYALLNLLHKKENVYTVCKAVILNLFQNLNYQ